ncbi:unnamed protein product [Arabis nemorensis]|uniref:Uncharacterized protein n=1 Tax=Arabis nemorensis TaxID=586526 RepID=A0A565BC29_9BRAS|nr:unnamed protein product [Arabis nemorensis]
MAPVGFRSGDAIFSSIDRVNAEFFTLTYGAIVRQLLTRNNFSNDHEWAQFQYWKSHVQNSQSNQWSSNATPPPETTNVPETQAEGAAAFLQVTINDLLLSEGRTSLTELNPKRTDDTTWQIVRYSC